MKTGQEFFRHELHLLSGLSHLRIKCNFVVIFKILCTISKENLCKETAVSRKTLSTWVTVLHDSWRFDGRYSTASQTATLSPLRNTPAITTPQRHSHTPCTWHRFGSQSSEDVLTPQWSTLDLFMPLKSMVSCYYMILWLRLLLRTSILSSWVTDFDTKFWGFWGVCVDEQVGDNTRWHEQHVFLTSFLFQNNAGKLLTWQYVSLVPENCWV